MKLSLKTISSALVAVSLFACSAGDSSSNQNPPGQDQPGPNDPGTPGDPSNPGDPKTPGPGPGPGPSGKINPIEGTSAATRITDPSDNGFFDGPVWFDNALYFSNYYNSMIVKYFAGVNDPFTVARPTTTYSPVGAAFNKTTNQFLTVEVQLNGPSQVSANAVNSPAIPLAITLSDGAWNSPNDLVLKADGSFYVTDPGYQQTTFVNRVYYVTADGAGTTVLTFNNAERPNGIALSLDESTLYVSFTATGQVLKYATNPDGTLGPAAKFTDLTGLNPDGMGIDSDGNVYVSNDKGVDVFSPDGKKWGSLLTDASATGLAFGGADNKTLFVTANGGVFQFTNLKVAGTNQ